MGTSGKRTDRKEYEEVKKLLRRKYAQRDIQKLLNVSTTVIGAIRHSDDYEDFYKKQYGELPEDAKKNERPQGTNGQIMAAFAMLLTNIESYNKKIQEGIELLNENVVSLIEMLK